MSRFGMMAYMGITFKQRIRLLGIVLIAALFFASPCYAADNLLINGGFEDSEAEPASWSRDVWHQGESFGSLIGTTEKAHSGTSSVLIENVRENDAKWVQTVEVEPNKLYKLSGFVLAENAGASAKGANLSVLGVTETSADFKNTGGEWKYVELYGRTGPGQKELKVAARVGGYGSLNTGKAYFDDLAFEEADSAPSGTKVISFAEQPPASAQNAAKSTSGTPFKILFYAILFFGVYAAAYVLLFRQNRMARLSERSGYAAVALLLASALLLRFLIAPAAAGHPADMATFKAWANHAAEAGLSHFYTTDMFADYPPGYIYVLYVLGLLRKWLHLGFDAKGTLFLMKLPAMLADGFISLVLFRMGLKRIGVSAAFGVALLFALNPAVIVNSAVWGQVDAFFTLFLLLTFLALSGGKLERAGILFALAVLIKPQALIFAPVLLFAFYRAGSWKRFSKSVIYGAGVFVLAVLPFSIHMKPLWIFDLYKKTLASYPFADLNAFNLYALVGANWKPLTDQLLWVPYQTWGTVFIGAAVALTAYFFFRGHPNHPALNYYAALVLISAMFLFGVKMHERYWFPALALALAVYVHLKDRRVLHFFLGLSICHFANVAYVLANTGSGEIALPRTDGVLLLASAGGLLLFGFLLRIGQDSLIRGRVEPVRDEQAEERLAAELLRDGRNFGVGTTDAPPEPPGGRFRRLDWMLMAGLTLVYAAIAFYHLGSNKAPETHWEPKVSGESFYIDLGGVHRIERINSFAEIGEGKLMVDFAKDSPDGWSGAQTVDVTYTKFFTWNVIKTDVEARYVRMTVETGGFTLNELALYEKDGQAPLKPASIHDEGLTPAVRGSATSLFDEPEDSFYHPTYMNGTYFDEIYHARTAYEHLHNMKPYENTHPPLGKLLIAIGIKLFGMNPFGWRIVGTLFGIAMVPLMYVFARRLFGQPFYAFMAAFLFTFDFMHFAQTRIATIDTYGVFFIMLMYYFMYRYISMSFYREPLKRTLGPLFLSGLFFGIGAASKWIVIYGGAGLAVLLFASLYRRYREHETARERLKHALHGGEAAEEEAAWLRHVTGKFFPNTVKTLAWCLIFFVAIPGVIYSASFLPYMTVPGEHISLHNLIQYQKDMWDYHSKLVATHGFASPWWEWPFMIKPIWFYSGQVLLPPGQVSSIVSMGNPIVWWLGTLAVPGAIILAWKRRDKGMAVALAAFFSQYLPWMLVTRLTFIYHFFAMVPFLVLCLVYVFRSLQEKYGLGRAWSYALMGLALGLFAMFYPILSGAIVSKTYVSVFLRWFPSWFFYS